jgi:hypothetical protein
MPKCYHCKWFENNNAEAAKAAADLSDMTCLAYPAGIPDEIFLHGVVHDFVRSDQSGTFVFEQV